MSVKEFLERDCQLSKDGNNTDIIPLFFLVHVLKRQWGNIFPVTSCKSISVTFCTQFMDFKHVLIKHG